MLRVRPDVSLAPSWRVAIGMALLAALLCGGCSKHQAPGTAASPANSPKAPVTKEDKIIAQGRAALGPEEKLRSVQTLALTGKVYDDKDQLLGTIQIQFKKPAHERSEFHSVVQSAAIEGSNGVEGWMLVSDKNGNLKLTILKAAEELQNVYEAMENLYFYRAAELVRGSEIASAGPVNYRNSPCWKVSFHYPDSVTYVRYLDQATGELRGTILEPAGTEFVEEGKRTVDGIIFPTSLRNYTKDGVLTQTVKFDSITVNPAIDDKIFETPSLIALNNALDKARAAAKAAATSPAGQPAATPAPPAATK